MARRTKRRRSNAPRFPLREMMERHGWSGRRLAKATGLDTATVSRLVNGKGQPSWGTILRLCTAMGADLGDLAPRGGAA